MDTERLKRILQAKQKLAANRNFWIVNAYTDFGKACYRVAKQVDEALHRNRESFFFVVDDLREYVKYVIKMSEIAERICRKLGYHYREYDVIRKWRERITGSREAGQEG